MSRRAIVALASVLLISAGLAAAVAAKPGPALLPGKSGGVLNVLTRRRMRPTSRGPKER